MTTFTAPSDGPIGDRTRVSPSGEAEMGRAASREAGPKSNSGQLIRVGYLYPEKHFHRHGVVVRFDEYVGIHDFIVGVAVFADGSGVSVERWCLD